MRPLESNGRVVSWAADKVVVHGLDDAALGDRVELEGTGAGIVTALYADRVELVPLSSRPAAIGSWVQLRGALTTGAGDALLGRTVDCLGRAIDGESIPAATTQPIFFRDPTLVGVARRRFTFGLLALDLQEPKLLGESFAIASIDGGGDVVAHVAAHQRHLGRIWIDARVTQSKRAQAVAADSIQVALDDAPAPAQSWLVPWTAMAIASALRASGRDVVVCVDHVDAWKQAARRFADRGEWHSQIAQIASHAYALERGSVTLLVRTKRLSPILCSCVDDGIDLHAAALGIPKFRSKLVRPPLRLRGDQLATLGRAIVAAASFEILRAPFVDPIVVDDTLDPWTRDHYTRLRETARARAAIQFWRGMPVDTLEQLSCVLAIDRRRDVGHEHVGALCRDYLAVLRARPPEQRAIDQLDELVRLVDDVVLRPSP